jgi:hypothetical protein
LIIYSGVPGIGNYHKSAGCFQEHPFFKTYSRNKECKRLRFRLRLRRIPKPYPYP